MPLSRILLTLLCLFGSIAKTAGAECLPKTQEEAKVVTVSSRGDILLADGRILRLAGVDWPAENAARERLRSRLSELIGDDLVWDAKAAPDRWGRIPAHIFQRKQAGAKTDWVQGRLVEDGHIHGWPERATKDCQADMVERIMLAQSGRLGVWSPLVRRSLKRLGVAGVVKQERVVYEGVVRSVRTGRSVTFVNFAGPRARTPALYLPPARIAEMRRLGRDAATFAGKRIRVFAEVEPGLPARLFVASAEAIEVLD